MATRRRRRRSRRRRRRTSSPSPVVVLAVALVAVIAAATGVVAYQNGWRLQPSGQSKGDAVDRFKGADGVTLVSAQAPDFWWTRVVTDAAIVDPAYLPGVPVDRRFKRVLIPTDLLFAPDSTTLEGGAAQAVEMVARQITDDSLQVIAVCHSSSDGAPASRQPLSLRRANSLADALEKKLGRPAGSILRIGKGDSVKLPKVDPDTPTGRALHRRCEVFVEVR